MAVQSAHHMGLGLIHQSFPIWERGCWAYWDSRMGDKIQTRGGAYCYSPDVVASLDTGIRAFYKLDEVGAVAVRADHFNLGPDLQPTGGATNAAGRVGDGLLCDGDASAFSPSDTYFDFSGAVSRTVTCFVNFSSTAGSPGVVSNWANGGGIIQWLIYHNGTSLAFRYRRASGVEQEIQSTIGAISTGQWYFVAIWHNHVTDEYGLRVNTTVNTASDVNDLTPGATSILQIGNRNNNAAGVVGTVDCVGFWDRELDSAELDEVYNSGSGLEPPFPLPNLFEYAYAGVDPYTYFDPGKGAFFEVDDATPEVPRDGTFWSSRTNIFDGPTDQNQRGFTNNANILETLTGIGGGAPDNRIVRYITGTPLDEYAIENVGGSPSRIFQSNLSNATNSRIFSVLARRSDGGVINASTLSLGVSVLSGDGEANVASGGTRYNQMRSDGWYRCWTVLDPIVGGPSRLFWVEAAVGSGPIQIEAPQIESFTTSFGAPTAPIRCDSIASRTRESHLLTFQGDWSLPASGWMGVTYLPRQSAADITYPTSILLRWGNGTTNRHRLLISNSAQAFVYQLEDGGVTQALLDQTTGELTRDSAYGAVATWGHRLGSVYFMLAVNGSLVELDTAGTIPVDTTSLIEIGSQAGANVAKLGVQQAGFGTRALSRQDCRNMSRWFQRRAQKNIV